MTVSSLAAEAIIGLTGTNSHNAHTHLVSHWVNSFLKAHQQLKHNLLLLILILQTALLQVRPSQKNLVFLKKPNPQGFLGFIVVRALLGSSDVFLFERAVGKLVG